MTTSEHNKPPIGGMGGSIHDWERSLDPWHEDAFPEDMKSQAPNRGPRASGWMALDWCGNPILFIQDGTEYASKE